MSYTCKTFKGGTHEGTSPCDWSLRLVPCSVYTKEIVAGTSPLKKNKLRALQLKFAETWRRNIKRSSTVKLNLLD